MIPQYARAWRTDYVRGHTEPPAGPRTANALALATARERAWLSSPQPDACDDGQSPSGGSPVENSIGRLCSKQCILAPYNLAPLNPRNDLPAPARRRETMSIRGLRPILTSPRAYWSNARRAWVFDSLHHPADAAPGAACPNRPR
ncbi:hypothetical protein GCM10007859_13320 [Brevundimonas denitrificans]|uniref:Uncharacterized protein n=1 Tax=Brevundimonas denitrificans TaxID=1443434 RepID=A0ABQ6BI03_9CAUL|nr:hypothetical protein GCM10007859_13320 [Brevundimonas denitrificans]